VSIKNKKIANNYIKFVIIIGHVTKNAVGKYSHNASYWYKIIVCLKCESACFEFLRKFENFDRRFLKTWFGGDSSLLS